MEPPRYPLGQVLRLQPSGFLAGTRPGPITWGYTRQHIGWVGPPLKSNPPSPLHSMSI